VFYPVMDFTKQGSINSGFIIVGNLLTSRASRLIGI
jgi:hypothetical protein